MKIKQYLFAAVSITLSLCICICVIIYAAQDKNIQFNSQTELSFAIPDMFELQSVDFPLNEETISREEFFILHREGEEASLKALSDKESDSNITDDSASTATNSTATGTTSDTTADSSASNAATTNSTAADTTSPATGENSTLEDGTSYSPVPVSDFDFVTVTPDYFDDAVFIGNSRLQGFILYSKLPDLCSYTYVGMSVKSYFTKETFAVNGSTLTAADALAATPGFKKVYLKLGINELGWVSTEQFIESYSKIIEHIYSCNPDATIFINSVLPVSLEAIEKDPTLSKEKITEYNQAIKAMAEQYGACYLDVASVFTGEDGYMPYSYSFDGVHLNADSIQLWLNYLLEHGIEEN